MAQQPPSSEDLRRGIPKGRAGDEEEVRERRPIGVEPGFAAQVLHKGRAPRTILDRSIRGVEGTAKLRAAGIPEPPLNVSPQFHDGDEDAPINWPEEDVRALQLALIEQGLLSKGSVRLGYWGPSSSSAYKRLLTFANREGIGDAADALAAFTQLPEIEDMEEPKLPTALSNPEDVKRLMRATAVELLGSVTNDQIDALTNTYLAAERGKAESDMAAEQEAINRGANFFTEAPTPDAAAQVEEQFPTQVAGTRIREAERQFFDLLLAPTPQIGG